MTADLVTYGKIIGAGLPVGAFGGREEVMNVVSPVGPVYQAGTLSGNPLAMAAGYALLSELNDTPRHYDELEQKATVLCEGLREVFDARDVPAQINQVGSMLSVFFTDKKVKDYQTASTTDQALFRAFFHEMLEQGIYLPPSPFESWFMANTLTEGMIQKTIDSAGASVEAALTRSGEAQGGV